MTMNNRLILDLRNGVGYALTRLSLLAGEVDHLVLRQSTHSTSTPSLRHLSSSSSSPSAQEIKELFQAIVEKLSSHLRTIVLSDFDFDEGACLPAQCLALLLQQALGLVALRLDSIRLSGSRHDFQLLAVALRQHPVLEEVSFSGCVPADESNTTLEPLAGAIASIQTLKLVEIAETKVPPSGAWTRASLRQLCQSKSLQVLRIRGVRFLGDNDIAGMAQALQSNTTMKELWILSCDLGATSSVGPDAIAKMLRVNKHLKVLGLNHLSFHEHAIAIAEALKSNTSLQGLHLCFRGVPNSQIYDSYAKLMEDNYVLEKLTGGFMNGGSDTASRQIDFYLKLNRNGRRLLLQHENSRKQWLNALHSQKEDLSSLFYLLSKHPSLCLST